MMAKRWLEKKISRTRAKTERDDGKMSGRKISGAGIHRFYASVKTLSWLGWGDEFVESLRPWQGLRDPQCDNSVGRLGGRIGQFVPRASGLIGGEHGVASASNGKEGQIDI